jgi:hypothetical protein
MKTTPSRQLIRWALIASLLLVATAATACKTIQYRKVQSQFEEAVRADLEERNPVIDRSDDLYREVVAALTDGQISQLDPKLKANAWMIRSYSEWRRGKFEEADTSAKAGLKANPVKSSRDDILLHLIPALVIDSEVMKAWIAGGEKTDPDLYARLQEEAMRLAIRKLDTTKRRFGQATPASTKYYVDYQRWRILQNWRTLVTKIPSSEAAARSAALARAKVDGKSLKQAAIDSRDAIPEYHFLRQQISAEGGG